MRILAVLVVLGLLRPSLASVSFPWTQSCETNINGDIYGYQAKTLDGNRMVSLRQYAGQSVLFVNLATY